MTERFHDGNGEEPRVIVRDRRKIDPETGELRRPEGADGPAADEAAAASQPSGPAPEAGAGPSSAEVEALEKELAERTADLQRLQAEYANYRKRVERDRAAVVASAKASVMSELLPLLDDLERADAHGDLTGPFKAVSDKLLTTLQRVGLEAFGAEGEPFDPMVHEAVQHATSPDVKEPTVTTVMRRGYRFGELVLRHAMVAVTDHEPEQPAEAAEAAPQESAEN